MQALFAGAVWRVHGARFQPQVRQRLPFVLFSCSSVIVANTVFFVYLLPLFALSSIQTPSASYIRFKDVGTLFISFRIRHSGGIVPPRFLSRKRCHEYEIRSMSDSENFF